MPQHCEPRHAARSSPGSARAPRACRGRSAARCSARSRSGRAPPRRRGLRAARPVPARPSARRSSPRSRAAACRGGCRAPSPGASGAAPTRFIDVGEPEARARHARPRASGSPSTRSRSASPARRRALRLVAVHELREVELELVPVARRVRALHLAQLALEAGVHDALGLGGGRACGRRRRASSSSSSKSVGKLSQYLKHMRQPWQISKTRSTSCCERAGVPVLRLRGVVGEPVGRLVRDRLVGSVGSWNSTAVRHTTAREPPRAARPNRGPPAVARPSAA